MIVRITDFYCKVYNTKLSKLSTYLLTDQLNEIKFEYYEVTKTDFNYFVKDNKNIYNEIIIRLFDDVYNKYKDYLNNNEKIIVIYDDNVLNVYGKDLYLKTFEDVKTKYKISYNINLEFEYKHIINAIPGEVISIETGFSNSKYQLRSLFDNHWCVNEHNKCPGIKSKTKGCSAYVVDAEKYKRQNFKKYFTLIDFNAHKTNYYTYVLYDGVVKLYHQSSVEVGLIDVVKYIEENKYSKYIDTIKKICYFTNSTYKNITQNEFFKVSPLSQIIKHYVDFKHSLLEELSLDRDVWIKFGYENIAGIPLKHIEMDMKHFNGNCDILLKHYHFLEQARNKNLIFGGYYSSEDMFDEKTGSNNFEIRLNLSDLGYDYIYEDIPI